MEAAKRAGSDDVMLGLVLLGAASSLALVLLQNGQEIAHFQPPELLNRQWHNLSAEAGRVVLTEKQLTSWLDPDASMGEVFRKVEFLGCGTDGLVWLARDSSGRIFALKRFSSVKMAEIELTHGLKTSHPNVVRAYQAVVKRSKNGTPIPYLLMEYVDGETLNLEKLSPQHRCRLLEEAASSISDLLKSRIAPADIWPENIVITKEGGWKWIDLGGFLDVPSDGIRLRQLELIDYLLRALAPFSELRHKLQSIYQTCCQEINFTQLLLGMGRVRIWRAEEYLSQAISAAQKY